MRLCPRPLLVLLALAGSAAAAPGAPPVRPAAEILALRVLAGTWRCQVHAGAPGAGLPAQATLAIAPDLDGFWLRVRVTAPGSSGGGSAGPPGGEPSPLFGDGFWGFDAAQKRLVAPWADARGEIGVLSAAPWRGGASLLEWTGELGGGARRTVVRDRFRLPHKETGAGVLERKLEISPTGDPKTFVPAGSLTCKKG